MAKAELEEKLHLSEAKKHKLEQRVNALAKQNAALAKGGQVSCLCLSSCCIASPDQSAKPHIVMLILQQRITALAQQSAPLPVGE